MLNFSLLINRLMEAITSNDTYMLKLLTSMGGSFNPRELNLGLIKAAGLGKYTPFLSFFP